MQHDWNNCCTAEMHSCTLLRANAFHIRAVLPVYVVQHALTVVSQTGRAAAEKDHLEPPRLLHRQIVFQAQMAGVNPIGPGDDVYRGLWVRRGQMA